MRTICDVCEGAPAILFCAADEAALCRSCDEKVHMCNKLASRHVRVSLATPNAVPRCDICENAPAFFYCKIDGSSLCLQCDMIVHVGGKRTHERYLLLRQRVEFPREKQNPFDDQSSHPNELPESNRGHNQIPQPTTPHEGPKEQIQNRHCVSTVPSSNPNSAHAEKSDSKLIDLNAHPNRGFGQSSTSGQPVSYGIVGVDYHSLCPIVSLTRPRLNKIRRRRRCMLSSSSPWLQPDAYMPSNNGKIIVDGVWRNCLALREEALACV